MGGTGLAHDLRGPLGATFMKFGRAPTTLRILKGSSREVSSSHSFARRGCCTSQDYVTQTSAVLFRGSSRPPCMR
jgi:hypothetical protein